jgi:hypothetical protein
MNRKAGLNYSGCLAVRFLCIFCVGMNEASQKSDVDYLMSSVSGLISMGLCIRGYRILHILHAGRRTSFRVFAASRSNNPHCKSLTVQTTYIACVLVVIQVILCFVLRRVSPRGLKGFRVQRQRSIAVLLHHFCLTHIFGLVSTHSPSVLHYSSIVICAHTVVGDSQNYDGRFASKRNGPVDESLGCWGSSADIARVSCSTVLAVNWWNRNGLQ